MNRSREEAGISLLEAMLTVLVLMMGIMAVTQLTRTMLSAVSPSESGIVQHPELVEQLLRDGAEALRASRLDPPPARIELPALNVSGATYSVRVLRQGLPAPENGFRRVDYHVEVHYQAPGADEILAGSVELDKVTAPVAKGGL